MTCFPKPKDSLLGRDWNERFTRRRYFPRNGFAESLEVRASAQLRLCAHLR
jgi:hypothetical protein